MTYFQFRECVRRCADTEWLVKCYWDMAHQELPRWTRKQFRIVTGELIKRGEWRA